MLRNISLFLISMLVATAAVECCLRLFAPVYHTGYIGVYQYDDEVGARLKPGLHSYNTTDYQQEVHTNALGTVNFQESFLGYEKLVFAIGDSYTQGTGLPSDASYPSQLDLLLNMGNGNYEKKYAVVNLGLAAFGAEQSILMLKRYEEIIGVPDHVLFLGAANDYLDDLKFRQGYKHRNFVDGSPVWGIFLRPLQWFRNDFEIGKRVYFFIDAIREQNILDKGWRNQTDQEMIPVAELQKGLYEELLSLCEKSGSQLIISWSSAPGGDGSYEFLQQWAAEHGVLFADEYPWAASVREVMPGLPLENSHSGGHYRTWVNQIIARSFTDSIQRSQ